MVQSVNVPGVGQLNFPDGMSQADMAAAIQRNFPQIHAPAASIGGVADQIPGVAGADERMRADAAPTPAMQPDTLSQKIFGTLEPVIATGTGIAGGLVGSVAGAAQGVFGGKFGTDEGVREADQTAGNVASALTYQSRTQTGQALTEKLGDALNDSGIVGVPIPELEALARGAGASRVAIAGLARPGAATADAADAAALAGRRKWVGRSPVAPEVVEESPAAAIPAPVNYDVPTFIRKGVAEPAAAPDLAVPTALQPPGSALDTYATAPKLLSPYGELPPVAPPIEPEPGATALDQYAAQRAANPVTFGSLLKESNREPAVEAAQAGLEPNGAMKSPLDRMIAGESLPVGSSGTAKITAGLRDDSDITAVLKQFGVSDEGVAAPTAHADIGEPAHDFSVTSPDAEARLQTLRDVGINSVRKSAIEGDPVRGATEFQMSKFDQEPAGMAARDQFTHERDALASHLQKLIDDTGAPTGLDESALHLKGQEIAAPYDAAQAYFEKAKTKLYDLAAQRAEEIGKPVTTANLDELLANPDFKATLMAKDQQGLLNTIVSQYERFKALDPSGEMTVPHSEQYRQWLNQVWSPETSGTLGKVKSALDADVFKSAGQDVYAAGRRMHMLEKQLLEDPHGISKLFDADPRTPINRATAYDKIPDAITRLSPDQFQHIIDTYRNFPPELQEQAQRAINTIKAHYGEKLLSTGMETKAGTPRAMWNGVGVKDVARRNSAKLAMLFSDPGELKRIRDAVNAGNILHVEQAYPGAAAQAAKAMKMGLMSKALGRISTIAGGGAGALLGPAGAGAGALVGEMVGGRMATSLGERAALTKFKQGVIDHHLQ